jgi:hypothetical protein
MSATEKVAAVEKAAERADERLAFLERVPTADTSAARHAVEGLRLEILGQFREDVAGALGWPAGGSRSEPGPAETGI